MLFSRAAVDLSPSTLNYLAGVIRRHRKAIGSVWRYVQEAVHPVSARSPKSAAALRKAERDGQVHLVRDGTLIRTDRVKLLHKLRCSPSKTGHLVKPSPSSQTAKQPELSSGSPCAPRRAEAVFLHDPVCLDRGFWADSKVANYFRFSHWVGEKVHFSGVGERLR